MPAWYRQMPKRDIARAEYVMKFRKRQQIRNSIKLTVEEHLEKIRDIEDGTMEFKHKKYEELVEDMH